MLTRTIFARGVAVLGLSTALVLGTGTIATASPPVSLDGYLYAGTYSSTTACIAAGENLRSYGAIVDYFCHGVKRASYLYIEPADDD
jgi:hypothetical protein